jgi:hypothetical protein
MATWQVHGAIDDVCLITNDNVQDWIPEGTLDFVALKQYPLCQLKTAIQIAVLARHGGFFIDADMICSSPLTAIREALGDYQMALYGFHLALVGAQPESAILGRWLQLLQQTLAIPRENLLADMGLDHIALGNYSFELLRNELASGTRAIPGAAPTRLISLLRKWQRHRMLTSPKQKYIAQIDPYTSGYIAEHTHRRREKLDARQRYESFWFDQQLPLSAVAGKGALVALHHSWTPAEYSALGFDELATDQSLLSRYLRSLLGDVDIAALDILKTVNAAGVRA